VGVGGDKGELQAHLQCIASTVLDTDFMTCCFIKPSHGQLKKCPTLALNRIIVMFTVKPKSSQAWSEEQL